MISTSVEGGCKGKFDYFQLRIAWDVLLKRQCSLLSFQALLGFEYMQTTEGTGVPYYVTSVQFHLMKLETPYIYFKLGVFQFPKEFLDR